MPHGRKQEMIYALITVPCFVIYCLSIENGGILNIDLKFALLIIPIEFALAYLSEFLLNFIPNFLQTFVLNFPFALCSQLFFIQPLTRKIFGKVFEK